MFILECSETMQMCYDAKKFLIIIKTLINVIQWSVPLLLIVLGTLDMFKAVTKANDEKILEDAKKSFIRRLIYGVIIFLIPFLVRLVLGFVENNMMSSTDTGAMNWLECWNNVETYDFKSNCTDIYEPDKDTSPNSQTDSGGSSSTQSKSCYVYRKYDCSKYSGTKLYVSGDYKYSTPSCRGEIKSSNNLSDTNGNPLSDYVTEWCSTQCYTTYKSYPSTVAFDKNDNKLCVCIYNPDSKITGIDVSKGKPSSTDNVDTYTCDSDTSCDKAFNFCKGPSVKTVK